MTASKKHEPAVKLEMSFEEALARLAQTDRKEIEDASDKVRQEEKVVDEYVRERERSIHAGARRVAKRFRP